MDAVPRGRFTRKEYADRIARVKRVMEGAGLDVLLCPDPANICYLTGYDGWSFYVPQLAVVALEDELPLWIGRPMDVNTARMTAYLPDDRLLSYPEDVVQVDDDHPMRAMGELLAARGWGKRRIGMDFDAYHITPRGLAALKQGLPGTRIIDAGRLVNWVRSTKTDAEIAVMREAATLADAAMAAAIEGIAPGVRQCDLAGQIAAAQYRGTPQLAGDYPAIVALMPTGKGTSAPHLTAGDDVFGANSGTVFELAGTRWRYNCPMTRTVHLGPPPQALLDTVAIAKDGMAAVVEAMRSGATAGKVESAWRATVEPLGLSKPSRIGYAVGLGYPPDWGEHTVSIRRDEPTVLITNQTVHIMLGIWKADWGVSISDTVRVTPAGGEPLTTTPLDVVVK